MSFINFSNRGRGFKLKAWPPSFKEIFSMLLKNIFPSIAFGANVADFLAAGKPVAIIDEYEIQGNQLEAFLDLHHSVFTKGLEKTSDFIK